jgi:hypothetical protein
LTTTEFIAVEPLLTTVTFNVGMGSYGDGTFGKYSARGESRRLAAGRGAAEVVVTIGSTVVVGGTSIIVVVVAGCVVVARVTVVVGWVSATVVGASVTPVAMVTAACSDAPHAATAPARATEMSAANVRFIHVPP